ncbi:viral A-type inclusion protein, putative [Babesia ovis]|uniref:Viral A-type inclusion protein, putative n=1 Tax=Babesia ovis TaxID=5869 RepID=A0A9W5TBK8_BABOV|nr:viral A-type inclusion protein, putative [Babesia ovis]
MGREATYTNLYHGGFATLPTQPSENDKHVDQNVRNDYIRTDLTKNGDVAPNPTTLDYQPVSGAAYGAAVNFANNTGPIKPVVIDNDRYTRTDMFDDCVTFVREFSSTTLGCPELQKFERNPYRSRYLNTPECEGLLTKHCQRILHSYYGRADALCTASICGVSRHITFNDVADSGLTSTDHLTSLATLSVLARYHKIGYLSSQLDDVGYCAANIYVHLLNVIRVIFAASAAGPVIGGGNNVDTARRFYSLLGRGVWRNAAEASEPLAQIDRRVAQRVSLLYALCIHLLDVLLVNDDKCTEEILALDGDLYETLGCVACCFVEQAVRSGDRTVCSPTAGEMLEDRLAPDIGDRYALFSKHWSILSGLLSRGVKFGNSDLLVKAVKALCNVLETANVGRSLLLWAYCVYVRLCPGDLSQGNHSIPRILFEYMTKTKGVLQLQAITSALAICMRDPGFVRYADDRMNPQKTFATFVLHSCNLIHNKMDDLAVPILQVLYLLFDTCPKALPDISSAMSGASGMLDRYSDTVGNAVETFLNVATLSIGPIQVIMALVMRRIFLRCDVTKSLNADLRAKFIKHLLAVVGLKKPAGATETDAIGVVSKVALLDAFVQSGAMSDLVSAMKDVNAKQLRLVSLHASNVSCESLHRLLCVGDIATKLVAYDALVGYRSDGMDSGTFVMCALCSAVKICPGVADILHDYTATYAGISEYRGSGTLATEVKFLRSLSDDSTMINPTLNMRIAGLLSVHAAISSLYISSEVSKQNLIQALLSPKNTLSEKQHQEVLARYKAQLSSQRREVVKSHARIDAQAREMQEQKVSVTKQMDQLREECTNKVERSKAELVTAQNQLNTVSSQAQQLDRECARLRTQVTELDQALRKLSAESAQTNEHLREAVSHRDKLKTEVTGLQGQLEQRDRTIDQLRTVESDNTRLNQDIVELNAVVERVYRMLIALMVRHRQLEGDLARSKEETAQSNRQLQERQLQVEELTNRCRNHENAITTLRVAKEGAESEVQRLGRELQVMEGRLGKSSEELSLLQARYTQSTQKLQAAEDNNHRLTEQLERCEIQLRQRGEQLSTIYSTFQDKKPY